MIRKISGLSEGRWEWSTPYRWTIYFGEPAEIKAIYRSMLRACERNVTAFSPTFADMPVLNLNRDCYGIWVNWDEYEFCIVSQKVIEELININNYKVVEQ